MKNIESVVVKISYRDDAEGQFSKVKTLQRNELIQFIKSELEIVNYDERRNLKNLLLEINIIVSNIFLQVKHFGVLRFEVFIFKKGENNTRKCRMKIHQVFELLQKIIDYNETELDTYNWYRSNKKLEEYITDITIFSPNILSNLIHSFMWLGFAIFCNFFPIKMLITGDEFRAGLFVIAVILPFWLPGLVIHINYLLKSNVRKATLFSHQIVLLDKAGAKTILKRNDIVAAEYVTNRSFRSPWLEYEHLILETSEGKKFIVNSLLGDIHDIILKLCLDKQNHFKTRTSYLPLIKTSANKAINNAG